MAKAVLLHGGNMVPEMWNVVHVCQGSVSQGAIL